MKTKTVFLDRDGVINRKMPEGDYIKCWEEFEFLPKAKEALKALKEAGLRIIIVTNQRGIARGLMTEPDLHEIHKRMLMELAKAGVSIDAIYYCPHDEGQCNCRKPRVGMFLQAQKDFPYIDLEGSFVIGDSLADMTAGERLGCRNILIADGPNKDAILEEARAQSIAVFGVAASLFDAVMHYVLPALSFGMVSSVTNSAGSEQIRPSLREGHE